MFVSVSPRGQPSLRSPALLRRGKLLVLQELFVIKQKIPGEMKRTQRSRCNIANKTQTKTAFYRRSPFTVQHVLDAGLRYDGVVTFEPLVLVLANEGGVVAALQRPLVVHHCKQTVPGTGGRRGSTNGALGLNTPGTRWDKWCCRKEKQPLLQVACQKLNLIQFRRPPTAF